MEAVQAVGTLRMANGDRSVDRMQAVGNTYRTYVTRKGIALRSPRSEH